MIHVVQHTWAVASTVTVNNYHISLNDLVFKQLKERINDRGCTLVQVEYYIIFISLFSY
jgi:hypothetical protein